MSAHDDYDAMFEDWQTAMRLQHEAGNEVNRLAAINDDLLAALGGLGAMPDGYCFCFNSVRDAWKPEHEHTGECREARAAIARATGEAPEQASPAHLACQGEYFGEDAT